MKSPYPYWGGGTMTTTDLDRIHERLRRAKATMSLHAAYSTVHCYVRDVEYLLSLLDKEEVNEDE